MTDGITAADRRSRTLSEKDFEDARRSRRMHVINCKRCKGSGIVGHAEDSIVCPECDGLGYSKAEKRVLYRRLWWEQKNRREQEK